MYTYILEPKAPLIIRSGRAFSENAGTNPARFPPPSTVAGALRAAHARSHNKPLNAELLQLSTWGPLAAKLHLNGELQQVLVPKPADALYFKQGDQSQVLRAAPQALAADEGCDLPKGLLPVQLQAPATLGKPTKGPSWWAWEDLLEWRSNAHTTPVFNELSERGWTPAADEVRTHIAMDQKSNSAEWGMLFQTAGLNTWVGAARAGPLAGELPQCAFPQSTLGIVAGIHDSIQLHHKPTVVHLGGERRLAAVHPAPRGLLAAPAKLARNIEQAKGLSLTLLSPALFTQGWRPGWLCHTTFTGTPPGCSALRVKLIAAAVNNWLPQSGWDLQKKQPKASRKMVPAGACYWFEIIDYHAEDIAKLWLANISDDPQDRRDGFGLCLPYAFNVPRQTA